MVSKYKFCISLPVHEKPDIINDQIKNIMHYYNNEVAIIIHISANFICDNLIEYLDVKENVYINSERRIVQWGDLMHVHNSNFKYACNVIDFDYFILHSSNDMYVRLGVTKYIEESKNGVHQGSKSNDVRYLISDGRFSAHNDTYYDPDFIKLMNHLEISHAFISHCEGSFFEKNVFSQMVEVIEKFYQHNKERIYPREEYWYATIIQKFVDVEKIAKPFLMSEVWRSEGIPIDEEMILRIHNGERIDDVVKLEYPYDYDNLYAVKRVVREYNDPNRILIRELMKK